MKKIIAGALVVVLLILAGCGNSQPTTGNVVASGEIKTLKMGLIPADDAVEMLRDYEPVKDYLSEKLGIPVEIQVTSDYTAAIEAMRAKHIDMAWFGPFSYIIASNVANAEAIVNGVKESTGTSTYKSIIIANAKSEIKTLDDLKGKSFAFVDPASTSGNLIPRKILIEAGIDPDRDFSETFFAGTHNAVEYAVANGKVDAGADSDNSYDRMLESGEIDPEVNLIIYESEPIPGSPIAVRGDLPKELKNKIQQALIDMDEQTIHKVDGWGGIAKYQAVEDSDYDVIRDTAKILGMDVTSAEAANK
ncbi:MAG: phosphonate ABC transporter substrate-binding protein [Candidatus Woesearchaeota archaeon]